MNDAQRQPLFLTYCEHCGGKVRWIHNIPEPHNCRDEQTRADDKEATPWKA